MYKEKYKIQHEFAYTCKQDANNNLIDDGINQYQWPDLILS